MVKPIKRIEGIACHLGSSALRAVQVPMDLFTTGLTRIEPVGALPVDSHPSVPATLKAGAIIEAAAWEIEDTLVHPGTKSSGRESKGR